VIRLPSSLLQITNFLNSNNLTTILIGGAVRDHFFNINTKDFDIEVYGCDNIDQLNSLLSHFSTVDTKGKKFGILSMNIDQYSFDFAMPRTETKKGTGHYKFDITLHSNIDYITAFKRRDFTINAIGYDIQRQNFIDPFNGIDDINNKILKHIDSKSFIEDPLRIYRAMQFISRFDLIIDINTLVLCQHMVKNNCIKELSRNRIKKEFLKVKNIELSKIFLAKLDLDFNNTNLS
jgi:tRNA nucleotidyltransferase (CCA-adding enzyme)